MADISAGIVSTDISVCTSTYTHSTGTDISVGIGIGIGLYYKRKSALAQACTAWHNTRMQVAGILEL
jgi:hypothetical protein